MFEKEEDRVRRKRDKSRGKGERDREGSNSQRREKERKREKERGNWKSKKRPLGRKRGTKGVTKDEDIKISGGRAKESKGCKPDEEASSICSITLFRYIRYVFTSP